MAYVPPLKTQGIRVLDVWVFGPFMLYAALKKQPLTKLEKTAIAAIGIGTVVYNMVNWVRENQREAEAQIEQESFPIYYADTSS
jgi:hypothetical protein